MGIEEKNKKHVRAEARRQQELRERFAESVSRREKANQKLKELEKGRLSY